MPEIQEPKQAGDVGRAKGYRGIWWVVKWSLAVLLLLFLVLVLLNVRIGPRARSPMVRVSPQTTWITSPLKSNGDVDYIAFMNQQYAVPPEKNAFVDLVRILGPKYESVVFPKTFFDQLGISPVPESGDYLKHLLFMNKGVDTGISTTVNGTLLASRQVVELTHQVPFAPGEFPAVDQWFSENEQYLFAIQAAVRKPGYYTPYGGGGFLSIARMPHQNQMKGVAWSIQRSSMLRLGRGDVAGAIDDQIALLRLARHVAQMGTPLEFLVGMVLEKMGHDSIAQTVFSGKCTVADLKRLAVELDSLPPLRSIDKRYLEAERITSLDLAIGIGRYGPIPWKGDSAGPAAPGVSWVEPPGFQDGLVRATIDWEAVCVELNAFHDELEKGLNQEGTLEPANLPTIANGELGAVGQQAIPSGELALSLLRGRQHRAKLLQQLLTSRGMLTPKENLDAWQRARAKFVITRVAVALELFRMEQGRYPTALAELVPQYVKAVPSDPCSAQPLIYRPGDGEPFQLYSVWLDGKDDGGVEPGDQFHSGTDLPAIPKIRTVQEWIDSIR